MILKQTKHLNEIPKSEPLKMKTGVTNQQKKIPQNQEENLYNN